MTTKVTIKKGFFWSAGRKYGWLEDGFGASGVGIEKSILQNNKEIIVEVNHAEYKLDCQKAREFINKYESAQTMPGGSIIGIVASDLLEKI